jgi:mRNA deadenylase 3'-5' endonuclease subunit Ccr4
MHWNILANKLAFGSFDKVPEKFLNWEYRFNLILQHIRELDPDVLGMSEVDCYPLYDSIRIAMY